MFKDHCFGIILGFVLILSVTAANAEKNIVSGKKEPKLQVIVVGGGLGGLVSAYELEKHGAGIQLLEMSERFGGRIGTAYYNSGLNAEFGMQEIWAKNPLIDILKELGLKLEGEESAAYSSILMNKKIYPFVQDTEEEFFNTIFTAEELSEQRTWLKKAEVLLTELEEKGMTENLKHFNEISFSGWLKEEKLSPKVMEWILLTLECEIGTSAENFSALSGLAEFRVFLFGTEKPYHVIGGNSLLVNKLAEKIKGNKKLGARVTHVKRTKNKNGKIRVEVTYIDTKTNSIKTTKADRVVIAIPWINLHSIQFEPPLPSSAWEAIDSIGFGQYLVAHFIIEKAFAKEKIDKNEWSIKGSSIFPILTRGPLGVIYGLIDETSPPANKKVFSLLLYGDAAKSFHMESQDLKKRELSDELEKLWPGFSENVSAVHFYSYHPAAVPFWAPGRSPYDTHAKTLFEEMTGLYLVGDYLVSSHSEGAVRSALRQVNAIITKK